MLKWKQISGTSVVLLIAGSLTLASFIGGTADAAGKRKLETNGSSDNNNYADTLDLQPRKMLVAENSDSSHERDVHLEDIEMNTHESKSREDENDRDEKSQMALSQTLLAPLNYNQFVQLHHQHENQYGWLWLLISRAQQQQQQFQQQLLMLTQQQQLQQQQDYQLLSMLVSSMAPSQAQYFTQIPAYTMIAPVAAGYLKKTGDYDGEDGSVGRGFNSHTETNELDWLW